MTDAILLLDKPAGMSSQQAVTRVKRLFNIKKAGHTGTLDPFATGLLPICLGQATKYADYLLQTDKRYLVTIQLGAVSSTGDPDGEIITCLGQQYPELATIENILPRLQGEQQQTAPQYSALKFQGKPLYYYARKGIQVPIKIRTINIYNLQIQDYVNGILKCEVHCSKGTYIRALTKSLGEYLNCGAYTLELRRLAVGKLTNMRMRQLTELEQLSANATAVENVLVKIEDSLDFPEVTLSSEQALAVQQGKIIQFTHESLEQTVKLVNEQKEFLGLGFCQQNSIKAKRMMAS